MPKGRDYLRTYFCIRRLTVEILSFLRDRPDMLHKFEGGNNIQAFPSPRSWFAVSDALELDVPLQDRIEMIKGDVGEEAAVIFETHLRLWETMPRLDDILKGKPVSMPDELNVKYCVAMGLATRIDGDNFDNAWKFLENMSGDIQTLVMKLAYKRDSSISSSPAFSKWAVANAGAFSNV